jgi:alanine transaminase
LIPEDKKEKEAILSSLKRRAHLLTTELNKLPGMSCQPAEGAMYAFPQITLSPRAVAAAAAQNRVPDAFYCVSRK